MKYITQQAKVYGMVPFYWDNGYSGNHGFALFDRGNHTTVDSQVLMLWQKAQQPIILIKYNSHALPLGLYL